MSPFIAHFRDFRVKISRKPARRYRRADLTDVLIRLLQELDVQLTRLAGDDPQLAADWHKRCALTGRNIEVATGNRTTAGVCQGIDPDGALVLATEEGPTRLTDGVVARIW